MPAPNPASGKSPVPPPEFFAHKYWLYDFIMSQIEPELMTTQVRQVEEKYKGETKEARTKRLANYDKAFAHFESIFKELMQTCDEEEKQMQKKMRGKRKKKEESERTQEISEAEDRIITDPDA